MEIAKNTPKAARKSTAGRKTATPPEIDGWGYETREIRPAVNVPTPRRPVIVGHARHGLAIDQEPTAAQPPAQPSFR